jgi:hypothetical protein
MSDLAHMSRGRSAGRSYAALSFALAAAVVWVLAGIVDDGLYAITGVLGVAGFGLGAKVRRDERRAGSHGWIALAAMILGGLLGAAVIVATIVWGLSHLV